MSMLKCFAAAVCSFSVPLIGHSAVVNGHFETGTLAGWTLTGLGASTGSSLGAGVTVAPPEGIFQGRIDNTGNGTASAPVVVGAMGVSPPSIVALGAGTPTVGSCITQDLTVNAGDTLSFDWNFLTDELSEDPIYNDFAFFSITPPSSAFFLASRNASSYSLFTPGSAFDGQTGWASETYNFTSAGTFKLGFAVFNVGDTGHNSILLLDNVVLTEVPEPGSAGMLVLCAAGMVRRRRR